MQGFVTSSLTWLRQKAWLASFVTNFSPIQRPFVQIGDENGAVKKLGRLLENFFMKWNSLLTKRVHALLDQEVHDMIDNLRFAHENSIPTVDLPRSLFHLRVQSLELLREIPSVGEAIQTLTSAVVRIIMGKFETRLLAEAQLLLAEPLSRLFQDACASARAIEKARRHVADVLATVRKTFTGASLKRSAQNAWYEVPEGSLNTLLDYLGKEQAAAEQLTLWDHTPFCETESGSYQKQRAEVAANRSKLDENARHLVDGFLAKLPSGCNSQEVVNNRSPAILREFFSSITEQYLDRTRLVVSQVVQELVDTLQAHLLQKDWNEDTSVNISSITQARKANLEKSAQFLAKLNDVRKQAVAARTKLQSLRASGWMLSASDTHSAKLSPPTWRTQLRAIGLTRTRGLVPGGFLD